MGEGQTTERLGVTVMGIQVVVCCLLLTKSFTRRSSCDAGSDRTIPTSSLDRRPAYLLLQLSQFTIRPTSNMDIENATPFTGTSISTSKPLAFLYLRTAPVLLYCIIQFDRNSPAHFVLAWTNRLIGYQGYFNTFI